MKRAPSILIIGSSYTDQGGIGSVFRIYKNQGFLSDKHYMVSHQQGAFWLRIYTFLVFCFKYIYHLLTNRNLKLIHAHLSQRGSFFRKALILMIGKLFRKKVIYHVHGSEFIPFFRHSPKPVQKFIRLILNHCDAIIVLSHSWKKRLTEVTDNPRIQVVYNPILVSDTAREYKLTPHEKPHFLFLGNIGKRKGIYDLLEAVHKIKEPNFTISLYGDGEVKKVQTQVIKLGLHDTIHVHGWISGSQKAEVLNSAHLLLLPSHNEGLPVAILEALSMGIPVLSTTVGGIPEAIEHGRNGFLIQPGDTDALAACLQELSSSPAILQRMSHIAYQTARQRFEYKLIFRDLENLYQQLLSSEAQPASMDELAQANPLLSSEWTQTEIIQQ